MPRIMTKIDFQELAKICTDFKRVAKDFTRCSGMLARAYDVPVMIHPDGSLSFAELPGPPEGTPKYDETLGYGRWLPDGRSLDSWVIRGVKLVLKCL